MFDWRIFDICDGVFFFNSQWNFLILARNFQKLNSFIQQAFIKPLL